MQRPQSPSRERLWPRRSSRAIKRALDLTGALVGLVFLSPIFAAIALAIRLDSEGPVLYRRRRVGQDGKSFLVMKFRTMSCRSCSTCCEGR